MPLSCIPSCWRPPRVDVRSIKPDRLHYAILDFPLLSVRPNVLLSKKLLIKPVESTGYTEKFRNLLILKELGNSDCDLAGGTLG